MDACWWSVPHTSLSRPFTHHPTPPKAPPHNRGCLTEKYAASATMQIASALAFMHTRGIVHRDMKPENLLLEVSLLPATYYLLPATCYLLPTTYYLLLATCYLLPATCYLLPATCYLLLAA